MSEPLLDVRDLRTEFHTDDGVVKAVDGVSFRVEPGQVLGIVGESGSGKSVTCLTLMGLNDSKIAKSSGEVLFRGEDLLKASSARLREIRGDEIAMIFQDPMTSLNPVHRIGRQLAEAVKLHNDVTTKQAYARGLELLKAVGIPRAERRIDDYPHQFSGGMRQRVMIAMALVNDPDLIIADEPTTALDVTVQAQILALLDDLRRERDLALVFITHDFGVVAQLCDRVAVMYAGRIVETGRTAEVLERPRHPYTSRLIDCVPQLGAGRRRLAAIPGPPPPADALPPGCAFAPRCPRARADCREGEVALERRGDRVVRCLYPVETEPAA
jgi:peptide/nickel transport system permease protein